ncbi:MAG: hypothetical protein ACKVQJ_04320 [Pyrinomonadaceae bacterium]
MRKTLIIGLIAVAATGCTVNLGTESNAAPAENKTAKARSIS